MNQKRGELLKNLSMYPLNSNVTLEDVTDEEEARTVKKKRSPSPQPGPSSFRRSSRLRNKKKTANSKPRSASPSPSTGNVSTASENREKSKSKKKRKRSQSSSSSVSGSDVSRSSSTNRLTPLDTPLGWHTLLHRVNGNIIRFLSNVPFVNNKPSKKACRYFTKSCMQRILTNRDKKDKNVTVLIKKINPNL